MTVLIAATAGCLPRGAPPAGEPILAERGALLVGLIPSNGDGVLRILLMRPGSTSTLANLSVLSLETDNHRPSEVLLVPDIDPVFTTNCSGGLANCTFDPKGTIEVDSKTERDDFYYVDSHHDLIEPPPTDVPEQVATGVTYFNFLDSATGPVLGLPRMTANGPGTQSSIGDPRSGMETALPFDVSKATMSPLVVCQAGAADDPTGPRYSLNPPATSIGGLSYLPNGQFLASSYVKDDHRARFMGIFHMEELRGDLVAGGFEDASPTKLASEFAQGAFAEPQGADTLAPGARIVYQFQARAASPYDGIWVVTCP